MFKDDYTKAKELSNMLRYTRLTDLQKKAFLSEDLFSNSTVWILIIGDTSSGKTLIPLMRFFVQFLKGQSPHVLFAVPYRALAAQKYKEISEISKKLGMNLNIQISTGEIRTADLEIQSGEVDIAVIIYEKIFMFASMDAQFLENYQILIMDEIGLTQDAERGIKADFIMSRAKMYPQLSVLALGTPYYDWSLYLKSYGFSCIREDKRPIKLKTFPIYVAGKTQKFISHVEKECEAVSEGQLMSYKNRNDDPNPRQWRDEIIEDICQYHLKYRHKILIFINNREEVRKLAQRLYPVLKKRGLIEPWLSEEEGKKYICEKMKFDEDEMDADLYGVFESEDYKAFIHGISFHNASLPNALRTLIEDEILDLEGNLKIVCCTETLAYGVNSNVDVVIIPEMMKQRPEEKLQNSFLRANEYMNYAGRAGRLLLGGNEHGRVGYVYPFIRAEYRDAGSEKEMSKQQVEWIALQNEIANPPTIFSRYFTSKDVEKPFYLLSLFPNTINDRKELTISQIVHILKKMPLSKENAFELEKDVLIPLHYLEKKKLIFMVERDEDIEREVESSYAATEVGLSLTGFIIRQDDFENLQYAIERSCDKEHIWITDFIMVVLSGEEIKMEILTSIGNLYKLHQNELKKMMLNVMNQFRIDKDKMSRQNRKNVEELLGTCLENPQFGPEVELSKNQCDQYNLLRVAAALLFWISPNCSVRKLQERFCIGYPQMQRLVEQVCYHMDIAKFMVPVIQSKDGGTMTAWLGRERVAEIQDQIGELSNALYYQAVPQMCKKLKSILTEPGSASEVRKITRMATYLSRVDKKVRENRHLTKKEKRIIEKYKIKINKLPDAQKSIFENFWEIL